MPSIRSLAKKHHFNAIQTYADFKAQVPVRDYEELAPYIHQIKDGKSNVLWPGKPIYLAKTSGTTSGNKYIPITQASIPYHILAARNALLYYIHETGQADFLTGKMLFFIRKPTVRQTRRNSYRQAIRDCAPPCTFLLAAQPMSKLCYQLHQRLGNQAGCDY